MTFESKVFNNHKTDYETPSLLMGEQDRGLFDTVNKSYPEIWKLYKTMKSLAWDENEFNYSSCNSDFKKVPKHTADKMVKALAWQWRGDSIAANNIYTTLAPFISSSELAAAWQEVSSNENVHAATYSEIVRMSFDNPREILDEVLNIEEAGARIEVISVVFAEAYEASHKYALGMVPNNQETYNKVFMFIVALYALEAIQFMSSFLITFSICDTGVFQPIGKAVQKIAQDELEAHVELDRAVLRHEMTTERGKMAMIQCKDQIQQVLDGVVDSEFAFLDYLHEDGEEEVGMNPTVGRRWSLWCAKPVYRFFGLKSPHQMPQSNPMKFMNEWLNISATQASPQEQDNGQYKVNVTRRTDEGKKFSVDF